MNPLHELADRLGILAEYRDQQGRVQSAGDATRVAILNALGHAVGDGQDAAQALAAWEAAESRRVLDPVRVMAPHDPAAALLEVRVPDGAVGEVEWTLTVQSEQRQPRVLENRAEPEGQRLQLALPGVLDEGYHRVRLALRTGVGPVEAEQLLIVTPRRSPEVETLTGRSRLCGIFANLYTLRSERNWGIGDLGDLGALLGWTAACGGAFTGVNPLHALRNRGHDVSPYSPVTRVFRNPIYLDLPAIPEFARSERARELVAAPGFQRELVEVRASPRIEYEQVSGLKRRVLELLYQVFEEAAPETRRRAFERYLRGQGPALTRFATFEALTDHLGHDRWREWPPGYRDSRSPEVARFAEDRKDRVRFHQWVQFELDRQMEAAAERGKAAGLALGLYTDLAIGASPNGADLWLDPELFVQGISLGAPPDDYSATGQNWGLPPINPHALRLDGYRYWIRLLRSSFAHAGALRIDHILGLFRQFWIPEGMTGAEGAYLRFPTEDLLGILVLEATRHRALVVGEDLGTVPPEVPPTLRRYGILSSRVFCFERNEHGFRPAETYEPLALTTVNTHDMPSLAGYLDGRDIARKREAGLIASDAAEQDERVRRGWDRDGMVYRLRQEGLLPVDREPTDSREILQAVHEFLCRTPSALVGFNLDDLVGEEEPVNVPGTHPDQFPAWRRKLSVSLETFTADPGVAELMRCSPESRRDAP